MNNSNTKNEDYIDLGQIFALLWKHIVLILTVGILCGAVLFTCARLFITPKYEASALFFVNNSTLSIGSLDIGSTSISSAAGFVDTYVQILQSRSNMELVIEQSGVDYTYEQLRRMVSAKAVNSTGLFSVTVNSPSPEEARTLVNLIAAILPDKVAEIVSNSSIKIVDYAVTPHQRVSPNYIKYAGVGLLFGIALCSGIILLISYFDDQIHNEDYLLNSYNYPVLATIPDLTSRSSGKYGYYYGSSAYGKSSKKGGVD